MSRKTGNTICLIACDVFKAAAEFSGLSLDISDADYSHLEKSLIELV